MSEKRDKPNRYCSKENKLILVNEVIVDNKSINKEARENNLDKSQFRKWIKNITSIVKMDQKTKESQEIHY